MKDKVKTKKAFSLAEMVVSLGVMSIVTLMLFNVLVTSIRVTYKTVARSFVREELSQSLSLISRDIKNADVVLGCGESGDSNKCDFILDGEYFSWGLCSNDNSRICKTKIESDTSIEIYSSSPSLDIESLQFSPGFGDLSSQTQRNILITVIGEHANTKANVTNVIRQQGVSTRNYEF